MLDPIHIHHLQQNSWFSHLAEPFKQFILDHGKKLIIEKNAAVFNAQDQFDVCMVFSMAQLVWVT